MTRAQEDIVTFPDLEGTGRPYDPKLLTAQGKSGPYEVLTHILSFGAIAFSGIIAYYSLAIYLTTEIDNIAFGWTYWSYTFPEDTSEF